MTEDREVGALRVLGIAGSLRSGSYNRALLRAARELAPPGMEIRIWDRLGEVPHYDADEDAEGRRPAPVEELKEEIGAAAGLLIATPEYNYSVPGVLKNAVDWASRPARASVLSGKPVALMGASRGAFGTVRGQLHLRQVLHSTLSPVLPWPEVLVARAQEKFDAEGRLTDPPTREVVERMLAAFAEWVGRFEARG